jgi:hypothetical protein
MIKSIKLDLNSPDICHVVCSLLEKLCFLMVDWARQSSFFKDIKVGWIAIAVPFEGLPVRTIALIFIHFKIDDQIKLLKSSWVEILLLDWTWKQCKSNLGHDVLLCVSISRRLSRFPSVFGNITSCGSSFRDFRPTLKLINLIVFNKRVFLLLQAISNRL